MAVDIAVDSHRTPALPPGPRTPAFWQLLHYTISPMSFLDASRAYGETFTVRLAGYGKLVMLSSPGAVRDVFRGDPRLLHSGEGNEFLSVTVGPTSVLVLDDEPHARQRRVLLPPLKGTRMRSYFTAMQAATLEVVRAWPRNQPVRMDVPMQQITLRTISQAVLGLNPGPRLDEFERLVRDLMATTRSRFGLILMKILPLGLLRKIPGMPYFRQLRSLDRSIHAPGIAERRLLPPEARGDNVLADLLAATHDDGRSLSDQEIRDAMVTLLIAGFETTVLALAWTLERIAAHPDVTAKIDDELQRVSGGTPPTAEHLAQLEYLDATIREGLRTRMIVPFVVRLTKQPFEAGGRLYPAGVLLSPCNYLVHLRPDLYPEPEKFRPERFLERTFTPYEWFPFGGATSVSRDGAALYEMKVVLSTLFSQVRLTRPAGARTKAVRRGIVMVPSDGATMLVVEKRRD